MQTQWYENLQEMSPKCDKGSCSQMRARAENQIQIGNRKKHFDKGH